MWLALWGAVALAATEVRPVAEPVDVVSAFRAEAAALGRKGDAAELACRDLAEQLMLCFVAGDERRYVTRAELVAWGEDLAAVEARAKVAALAGFNADRPAMMAVDGLSGRYWLSAEGDGLDAAALLYPERLAAIVGGEPVVAVPAAGVLLMWVPGDKDLDKVMAVGVRQMHDASEHPVSSRIYRWNGQKWVVWGQAVERLAPSR